MKYLIYGLILVNILILIVVYVKISQPLTYEVTNKEIKEKELKKQEVKLPKIYNFPARILYMSIDFRKYRYIVLYRVILNVKDKFEIFNIKTLLKSYNLIYSLIEEKKGLKIYILFKNLEEAKQILNLFKEYNFKVKIQKIKQRI